MYSIVVFVGNTLNAVLYTDIGSISGHLSVRLWCQHLGVIIRHSIDVVSW